MRAVHAEVAARLEQLLSPRGGVVGRDERRLPPGGRARGRQARARRAPLRRHRDA